MITKDFRIEGMNCSHCAMAVKKELSKIQGLQVKDVRVGSVSLEYDESLVTPQRIREAVEEAGYALVG